MRKNNIWWLYVTIVILTIACSKKSNATSHVNDNNGDSGLMSSIKDVINNATGSITQEKDLTMADYANLEVGPFESFVDLESQFKQICAQRGEQGKVWFFADSVDIAGV